MQELPNLHRNYSSGAIIEGSVHPTTENILLLKNIDMDNYTAVHLILIIFIIIMVRHMKMSVL